MISTLQSNTPCIIELKTRKTNTRETKFEEIMLETVDEVFSSLGHTCKQAIYAQLKETFKIKKREIPIKLEEFANAIEQIFGPGARFIELKIIEKLHQKTPNFLYIPHIKSLVFADYVTNLRRFFTITHCEFNSVHSAQRKRTSPQHLVNKPYFIAP
ncbi:MAG: hypothetical protein NWE94_10285 [Candidatus Bathyarchaeota archaeon]|nr:hypothetical protein [Candidatus Bathyarchaeota archaeon]